MNYYTDNSYRRRYLATQEPYKDLMLIEKFDTASLTVKDLWELKERAYREGYLRGREISDFKIYGLEG